MPVASEPQTVEASAAPAAPAHACPPARAFACGRPLTRTELLEARVRWPRPSSLQAPLQLPGG
ncbi:MAG TPA: hypothetical protein VED41_06575, partial [Solirubrobacteraceae bacterium]|nr:hypothetical protein [Solirubrobacteraceae bacterium]